MSNELTIIDGYCEVTKTSLSFKRDVTKDEWQKVFDACRHVEGCIQFWIGDLLKYREQRWGMYGDIAEKTGIEKRTLEEYKYVSDKIEPSLRNENLGFHVHKTIAPLKPEKQAEILQRASENKWTVRETRQAVKSIKRGDENRKAVPIPDDVYKVIYADPPWAYNDRCEDGAIQSGGADKHYPTLTMQELCDIEIPKTEDNAVLFLWTTSPLLEESFEVVKAWEFKYKASFVWDKVKHNMGHYNSVRHEFLLICTKGSCTPDNLKLFDSVQSIEKTAHSKKPDEFYEIIETLYNGNKIELFARNKRSGWDAWGNEI